MTSCEASAKLYEKIQWEHSYVAGDKTFCIYLADGEASIREHARLSGFPANEINCTIAPKSSSLSAPIHRREGYSAHRDIILALQPRNHFKKRGVARVLSCIAIIGDAQRPSELSVSCAINNDEN